MKKITRNILKETTEFIFDGQSGNILEYYYDQPQNYEFDYLAFIKSSFPNNVTLKLSFIYIDTTLKLSRYTNFEYIATHEITSTSIGNNDDRYIKVHMPLEVGKKELWKIRLEIPKKKTCTIEWCVSGDPY